MSAAQTLPSAAKRWCADLDATGLTLSPKEAGHDEI